MVGKSPVDRQELDKLKQEIELFKTMLGAIKLSLESQEVAVKDTQNTANHAVNLANDAQNTANHAVNLASDAQNTANHAVNLANDAQNTANHAVNLANDAQNTANHAVNLANGIQLWVSHEFVLDVPQNGKTAELKMLPADKHFAFLTGVAGFFRGGGERIWLEIRADNHWYLCGLAAMEGVQGRARCARIR
ncbi:MAG: hypothetical protein Cpurp_11005 [Chlorogloea purpurea SAG 13.99]|jgi:hypothetical protein|nr:hypothetical protein [Chlorogloea purpurea SAG 13.99]